MLRFVVSGPLREYAGNRGVVELDGAAGSAADALALLWADCPAIRDRVVNELGELRPHVNVFVDGQNIRHAAGLATATRPDSEIFIFPALSGG